MVRFSSEVQKRTKALISEYENDKHATYAAVHNHTVGLSEPEAELMEVKQYLEYLLACEAMEEYSWERDEMGQWHYVTTDEFFRRWGKVKENEQ